MHKGGKGDIRQGRKEEMGGILGGKDKRWGIGKRWKEEKRGGKEEGGSGNAIRDSQGEGKKRRAMGRSNQPQQLAWLGFPFEDLSKLIFMMYTWVGGGQKEGLEGKKLGTEGVYHKE